MRKALAAPRSACQHRGGLARLDGLLEELAYACAERLLREHRTSGRCNRTDFDRNVGSQDFCGCDAIVD